VPKDRVDGLIRAIYLLGGGALAVSLALFLRSESLELDGDLVLALQASWALLFTSLAAAAVAQFLLISDGWPASARLFLVSGLVAFVGGLALLAFVSLVALGEANSEDDGDEQDVHAVLYRPAPCLVDLPNAAGARPHPGSGALAPRRGRGA
jgi:hypothetical protein